ncbi:hypothetical protein Ae201684P_008669 [Aphanomyces euteiches]|nr:hypothetical protein Ae201684P_008669 [Aphanomyces euteiches]
MIEQKHTTRATSPTAKERLMNTQTYIYDIIFHVVSMTWIFMLLSACIVLLCVQVDGAITFNMKWNSLDKLTRLGSNNDCHLHCATNHDANKKNDPSNEQSILRQQPNPNAIQQIQDMERQLLKASQENQRLDIQRQSLQRLLHRLVQGGAVVDDTMDPQQMEAHDDTRVAALEREDPMENIWIESMRSPSESNRDLISTKLSPQSTTVEESCDAASSAGLTLEYQSSCDHSQLEHSLQTLPRQQSECTSSLDVTITTDTCTDSQGAVFHAEPIQHVDDMDKRRKTDLLCVVPTIVDASDAKIRDAVQRVKTPTALPNTAESKNLTQQLEIVKPFNPECHHTHEHVDESQWVDNNQLSDTKGGLAVDQPNDELLPEPFASIVTIDIVMQQIETCLRAFDAPTDWKTQVKALWRLELAFQEVTPDISFDGVPERIFPLAEHVNTLLSSIRSKVVKHTCGVIASCATFIGSQMALFNDQVILQVLHTARVNIKVFRQAGDECMQAISTHSRYSLDIILDYFDTVEADDIRELILKQLQLVMTSWSKLELQPHYDRLKILLGKGLGERREPTRETARRAFCAFCDMWVENMDEFVDIPSSRLYGAFSSEHPTARITLALSSKFGPAGQKPKRRSLRRIRNPILSDSQSMMPDIVGDTTTCPRVVCDRIIQDEETKCAPLANDPTAGKTSTDHLPPTMTSARKSSERCALSLQTISATFAQEAHCNLFIPLPPCVELSTQPCAEVPCEEMIGDNTLHHRPQEQMTVVNEHEEVAPLTSIVDPQDTHIEQPTMATGSAESPPHAQTNSLQLDLSMQTMAGSDLCDCTSSESTLDVYSSTSNEDLAVRPCPPCAAMPASPEVNLAHGMVTIDNIVNHGVPHKTLQVKHAARQKHTVEDENATRSPEIVAPIDQVPLMVDETSLQPTPEHHPTETLHSMISTLIPDRPPQRQPHARPAQSSRTPREDMKARSRRVYKTLPEVVEKKRQDEQMRERKVMLEKAKLFEQARQEKRRYLKQQMACKTLTHLDEKQQ